MRFTISALNMSVKRHIKIGDAVLVLTIVIAAAGLFWGMTRTKGSIAEIALDGKVLYSVDLSDPDNNHKSFTVTGKYQNTLTVEDGKIFVSFSDCPNKTCVHSGKISHGSICCAPNGMTVTVVSDSSVDVVSR